MIDVGVIGFGLAGRAFHAQVIHATPGLRLAAIVQRNGTEAAEKYPNVRVVRSVEELLAIPEIRLVVIATPNDTHAPLAHMCIEAGRDVVVDKPFATTFEEARELVDLARKRGRLITVYQNRRYDGDFQAIRQLVAEATLGRVVRFETNYDRFRPELKAGAWRERRVAGAGILYDLCAAPDRSRTGTFWFAGRGNGRCTRGASDGAGGRRVRCNVALPRRRAGGAAFDDAGDGAASAICFC